MSLSITDYTHQEDRSPYLPPEIWSAIFQIGRQMQHSPSTLHSGTPIRSFPLLVSHVCRLWRDISINTPSLWTWIDYGTESCYGCELVSADLVEEFIKRSRDQPLDIRLSSHSYGADLSVTDENYWDLLYQDAERALDVIFDHAWRWQSAHLNLHSEDVELVWEDDFLSRLVPLAAPLLRRLWFYSESYDVLTNECLLQGGAPRLEFLKVEGAIKHDLFHAALPKVQVAEFALMDGMTDLPLGILDKTLSLVTLSVPAVADCYAQSGGKAYIPTLRTLKISGPLFERNLGLRNVLSSISAPALNRLVFSDFLPSEWERFPTYLERITAVEMFPVLDTLEIIPKLGSEPFDPIDEHLMRALPTIEHLIVVEPSIHNTLRLLSTTALWSSLTTIQIGKNIAERLLVDMLHHRALIRCPITKLFLPSVSFNTNSSIDYETLKKSVHVAVFDWLAYCVDSRDIGGQFVLITNGMILTRTLRVIGFRHENMTI
jgi:hypothetical protein